MLKNALDNQNSFWQYLGRLFDAVMLNLLWLVCSLPVVTLGAATAAVYSVTIAKRRDRETKTAASFFQAFRENLMHGSLGLLLFAAILAFLGFDLWYFGSHGNWIAAAAVALVLVIAAMICTWFFIVTAVFDNTFKNTLVNAAILALRHPVRGIGMLLIFAAFPAIAFLSLSFYPVLFMLVILFGFGVCAFFQTALIMPVFEPYFPENQESGEAEDGDEEGYSAGEGL